MGHWLSLLRDEVWRSTFSRRVRHWPALSGGFSCFHVKKSLKNMLNQQKRLKTEKKYFHHLLGASSTQKLSQNTQHPLQKLYVLSNLYEDGFLLQISHFFILKIFLDSTKREEDFFYGIQKLSTVEPQLFQYCPRLLRFIIIKFFRFVIIRN